jgi:mannan endo-1,4-beta-mannosidase
MTKIIAYTISFILTLLCTINAISQYHYVQVQDTHFVLEGKPYYFVGTNFWYGCFIGSTGQTGDTLRLRRELDRLKSKGIDNLRILGASEASTNQKVVQPAIQISPGIYNDSLLIGLDFLLSEMGKRDMKAVIFLNNFWNWSGGMDQYNSWFSGGSIWDGTSFFYRNVSANAAYKHYISDLIRRQNTVSGLFYYEDTAIMAWELANEPRPGYNSTYLNAFYQWVDSIAHYIHSIDTNHLVTTGSEGKKGCLERSDVFLTAHQSPFIDYATIHLWAMNWEWIDAHNMDGTYSSALSQARTYISDHIGYARQLNKPLTMEEFGLPRDNEEYSPNSATTFRDKYYDALLELIYDSAATGAPIAGSNFWGWGGEARSPNSDYTWRAGDPFMCDPPMEMQGWNSVFDTDSSTIGILKKHSLLMAGLRVSTGVAEQSLIVHDFSLEQNYPNPFNPATTIRFFLKSPSRISLIIYNLLGQTVKTLAHCNEGMGTHTIVWDGTDEYHRPVASGMYVYKLQTDFASLQKKTLLVR